MLTMRYKKVTVDGQTLVHTNDIENSIRAHGLYWLLDCEFDDAIIEITHNTLLWRAGIFYWGKWLYGIFYDGEFRSGDWEGGVFFGGKFKSGTWKNGVWKGGDEFNGKWIRGTGR